MKKTRVIQSSQADRTLSALCTVVAVLFAFLILFPCWTVVMDSLSGSSVKMSIRLLPDQPSLEGYVEVLSQGKIAACMGNSVFRTALGTVLCVLVTYTASFAITRKTLPFGRVITALMVITMYFSGGLIPSYLTMKSLNLINNKLVLVLPHVFSAYYILVMRNFISDIPAEMQESAMIDGADDLVIAFRIYLPLVTPIIATVALWSAVGLWNEWFGAMIYASAPRHQVLQGLLRNIINQAQAAELYDDPTSIKRQPSDTVKAVTIVITTLPIIFVYPFAQRYFIAGLTSGAVKG